MKVFIEYEQVRNDAWKLAHKMYKEDNFVPDIIYASLRGGAYMANTISEYYKAVRKNEKPILYATVVARSYDKPFIGSDNVIIDGWTYSPEHLRPGDNILLVDDIWDSGQTMTALISTLMKRGIHRNQIKVAVHDWKLFVDETVHTPFIPDYYCKQWVINSKEENTWIHYNSHELVGLSKQELKECVKDTNTLNFLIEDLGLE